MERLTERACDGTDISDSLYEEITSHKISRAEANAKILAKLADYEDLEEQGSLLKLPCKVGDIVYVIETLGCRAVEEYTVIMVDYHSNLLAHKNDFCINALLTNDPRVNMHFHYNDFGKTVFLTKSGAEAKLKEWRVVKNE